ncbi:hypothetical protein L202_08155 [Cryptococcus amylolentus CBS 6039]|uniref:Uncharacterized protein n=1 Tax=Cryptococcus amylolentus CBS 6039 TaxID=1295533 RepID=A0A1E3H8Q7_9TREE|nr:hypothetical protein L202_08155 [Cryptococcus amylolentus CBS 6039]ODN72717.1 hypothetical protein L202_08155 [Cryptococcus amylolentus CBS 6039]
MIDLSPLYPTYVIDTLSKCVQEAFNMLRYNAPLRNGHRKEFPDIYDEILYEMRPLLRPQDKIRVAGRQKYRLHGEDEETTSLPPLEGFGIRDVMVNMTEATPPAELDPQHWNIPYGMQESISAYKRVATDHGWQVPSGFDKLAL